MTTDIAALGWDDRLRRAYARHDRAEQQPGRAMRVDRGVCTVLTPAGTVRASLSGAILAAAAADPVALPCTGDWLVVRLWPDRRRTVEAVLPRRTAIVRATAGAEALGQVLAANVDAVAVVEPMDPEPDLGRIERLLSLAWESGAPPLVVLTKADLAADPAAVADQVSYAVPGVAVHPISARTGAGLDPLRPLVVSGQTLGLLGPSGAGKSSLVNALAGAEVMGTRSLRADGRGRHTTTYRALVPLPGGGAVLDTPGVRAVGLFAADQGLDRTFIDIVDLAEQCRFVDCGHGREPGCAVVAALVAGELAPRRLESWRRLQRELAYETRRRAARGVTGTGVPQPGDARLAAEEIRRWKRMKREQRQRAGKTVVPRG